ncbi:hypothetical protein GG344DRAFT_62312 [Lentinula edodes]|nr:hypothetical protein GG344DRAFT_62312 [Lentinula edodes]
MTKQQSHLCTAVPQKPSRLFSFIVGKRIIKTLFSLEDPTEMSLFRQNDSKLFTLSLSQKVAWSLGRVWPSKNATHTAELEPRTDDYCARRTMDEMDVLGSLLGRSWSGLGAFLRLGLSFEAGMGYYEPKFTLCADMKSTVVYMSSFALKSHALVGLSVYEDHTIQQRGLYIPTVGVSTTLPSYVINHSTRHPPHGERYSLPSYPVGFYYAVRFSGKHSPKSVGVVSDSVISFFGGFNIWKGKGSILAFSVFVCVEGFAPDSTRGRPLMFFASLGSSRFPWQFKKVEEDAAATPDISYLYTTVGC